MSMSEIAPMPRPPKHTTRAQREARAFGKDLANLIERAQNAKDLRYTPICVDLLLARKRLTEILHPDDRGE